MRAAIFNPYFDTLGGGEKYTISFAKVLYDLGYEVDIEWKDPAIIETLEDRFGLKLESINVVPDIKRGDGYDLCFWVSDGSIPALRARRNFIHFQVPFHDVGGSSLINRMKFFRVAKVICNSNFTKKIIDAEYGVNSLVIYPPVSVSNIKPKRKDNIILSVGRFSKLLQSKHQDILIKVFKKLYDKGNRDWKLVLAGGVEVGDGGFTRELSKMAEGYPVEIIKSPKLKELKDLYGKSKIFWSASGFSEDETINPEKVEHFGITVIEAMAAGAVPVVYAAGGHKETIEEGKNGYLWTGENELLKRTLSLITDNTALRKISRQCIADSKQFSFDKFREKWDQLV
jgi:glycosyltransferase involved in cell wall biosynthesis